MTGLTNGEPYKFQFRAQNEVMKNGEDGGPAVSATGTPWPVVTLVLDSEDIAEDGGESIVTATVTNAANRSFTVTVTANSADPAAFTKAGSTLRFAADAGVSTGDVKITAVDNIVDAGAVPVVVTVSGTLSTGSAAPDDVTITITDDDDAPSAPDVTAAVVSSSAIRLSWGPPAAGTSPITHFEYRSKIGDLTATDAWVTIPGSNSGTGTYVVTGLTAETSVQLRGTGS